MDNSDQTTSDDTDETLDEPAGLLSSAVKHGLISAAESLKIESHADEAKLSHRDAALALSILTANQIDALTHLQQPGNVAPHYVLRGLVGIGASGIVYRATQSKMEREVALKTINAARLMDATSLKRIQREATVIAKLSHPNIVTAHDCGVHNGNFYIAMELVDGEDLLEYIQRHGTLSERDCWLMIQQIAAALAHANEQGLIHRDIKPANVLVSKAPAGTPLPAGLPLCKVVDFGLAYQSADSDAVKLTAEGNTLGTPAYVAPEQLANTNVDLRADVYSLGATAFHMLSGFPPFAGRSVTSIIVAKTTGDDEWREELRLGLSDRTVELIRDMTQSDPANRIQDYGQLFHRITDTLEHLGTQSSFASNSDQAHSRTHQNRTGLLVKSLTAMLLLIPIAWFSYGFLGDSKKADPIDVVSAIEYVKQGDSVSLFDGVMIPFNRYAFSGNWSVGKGLEGTTMKGKAGSWMELPLEHDLILSPNRELEIGVLVEKGEVAEIVLPKDQNGTVWAVRLANQVAQLTAIGKPAVSENKEQDSFPRNKGIALRSSDDGDALLQRLQLLLVDGVLTVLVHGAELGRVRCAASEQLAVKIVSQEGDAEFADLTLTAIVAP